VNPYRALTWFLAIAAVLVIVGRFVPEVAQWAAAIMTVLFVVGGVVPYLVYRAPTPHATFERAARGLMLRSPLHG
jgi:hypothetical protein